MKAGWVVCPVLNLVVMSEEALDKQTDAVLWQSFKKGDYEAFEVIYRRYFQLLGKYGSRFTNDPTLLEDAVQDLFVSLWKRREQLGSLSDVENLKFYLLRSLRNQLIRNSKQSVSDRTEGIDDFLDYLIELSSEQKTIEDERTEAQVQRVRYAVDGLSPRQREAIHLRFYQGMSLDQIAAIMGISKQVVSNMLFKAYTVLRMVLRGVLFLTCLS